MSHARLHSPRWTRQACTRPELDKGTWGKGGRASERKNPNIYVKGHTRGKNSSAQPHCHGRGTKTCQADPSHNERNEPARANGAPNTAPGKRRTATAPQSREARTPRNRGGENAQAAERRGRPVTGAARTPKLAEWRERPSRRNGENAQTAEMVARTP